MASNQVNPFRQLHPTLKKCKCGFVSSKCGFTNHMQYKERTASAKGFSLQWFFNRHGEVPIYEDSTETDIVNSI